jgi:hypothetical protein
MKLNLRRAAVRVAFVVTAIVAGALARQAAAEQPVPPQVREAARLVRSVSAATSDYQHAVGPVVWPGDETGSPATCHTDCSGFLNALLKHSYGLTDEQLSADLNAKRPLAKHYFAAIEEHHSFQAIDLLTQAQPGDIIAVRYKDSKPGENTGHVMLMAGTPRQRAASEPVVAGTIQWEVPVIDESESGHGLHDTRHLAEGGFRDGLGAGVLRIYTDRTGKIVGHSWSVTRKSKLRSREQRPLVIGRLEFPEPTPAR